MSLMIPLDAFVYKKCFHTGWKTADGSFTFHKVTENEKTYWEIFSDIYYQTHQEQLSIQYQTLNNAVEGAKQISESVYAYAKEFKPKLAYLHKHDFALKQDNMTQFIVYAPNFFPHMDEENISPVLIEGRAGSWRVNELKSFMGIDYMENRGSKQKVFSNIYNIVEKSLPILYSQSFKTKKEYYLCKEFFLQTEGFIFLHRYWWLSLVNPEINLANIFV